MNTKGSAMVETAVLLPVYVLVIIGLIYFSNETLHWQEVQLSARFLATNTRANFGGNSNVSPLIANTSGAGVPDEYFVVFSGSGQPTIAQDSQSVLYSQQAIRDELIKASWDVTRTQNLQGDVTLNQQLTGKGNVIYGNKQGLFGVAVPGEYSFDGDDALIADELSSWFKRKSATVTLTYDSRYIHVGKWTLPSPTVTGEARAVVRESDDKERKLWDRDAADRHPVDQLVEEFNDGSTPIPDYPDFGFSDGFWTPN